MGRTYTVPRNVKGESRILYIFSTRSFLTTLAGGLVGFFGYLLLNIVGLGKIGLIVIGIFALIGYLLGTLTIPDSPIVGILRKAGGEKVLDILIRTITFRGRKKIYVYREGGIK